MKNNKGFTLIELLVVVAIIGILAAVGTVAYTGYTASAKKNATKSNYASAVKYVAAELQKCNVGETTYAKSAACNVRKDTAGNVATAVEGALSEFKNPEDNAAKGVVKVDPATTDDSTTPATVTEMTVSLGQVSVADDAENVYIAACFAEVSGECVMDNSDSVTSTTVSIE